MPAGTSLASGGDLDDGLLIRSEIGRNLTFGLLKVLGRAIVAGDYRAKPFPYEADLARQYGVSRTVTREAMKMLAAKGMVSARPKQGSFVLPEEEWNLFDSDVLRWLLDRRASLTLLRQFNELRFAVEPQAAALAAERASAKQIAAIEAGLQRMIAAEDRRDDPLDADIAFHLALLRASGNPFLIQIRGVVATALHSSINSTNAIAGRTASIPEHAAVYEAIAARDPDAAAARMRELISDVLKLIDQVAGREANGG